MDCQRRMDSCAEPSLLEAGMEVMTAIETGLKTDQSEISKIMQNSGDHKRTRKPCTHMIAGETTHWTLLIAEESSSAKEDSISKMFMTLKCTLA